MQRLALALALITTILCASSPMPAHAGSWDVDYPIAVCGSYPPWYPRGWELIVRPRCRYFGSYYYHTTYHRYPSRAYGHHHRPYLRPGWWW
jgi:hypothetical protein